MDSKWVVTLKDGAELVVEVTHTSEPNDRRYVNLIAKNLPGSDGALIILRKPEAKNLLVALQKACGLL